MSTPEDGRTWVPLTARERRVIGVLVEKGKTTPEAYPLTVNAVVTGCNQKTNREPLTNYDADDVEEILQGLRKKGATIMVDSGGLALRWRHTMYEWLKVTKVELAVLAELMLRGPQTEGDLRARASRMEPLADLPALQAVLEALATRDLVIYLSPPGRKRGVLVSHGLYPPAERERVMEEAARENAAFEERPAPARIIGNESPSRAEPAGLGAELATLRAEVDTLRATLQALAAEVHDLKTSLGA